MVKARAGNRALVLLLMLMLWPAIGFGFRLREVSSLPINKADSVFGQATDNIIIKKDDRLVLLNRRHQFGSEVKLDSSQSAVVDEKGLFYAIKNRYKSDDSIPLTPTMTIYSNREVPLWSLYNLVEGIYFVGPSGDFIIAISGTPGWFNYKMYIYHKERPVTEVEIESFQNLQFNSDGEFLLIDAGAKGLKLYDTDGEFIQQYDPQKMSAFSEQGKELVAYDFKGFLRIYDDDREKLKIDTKQLSIRDIIFRQEIYTVAIIYDFNIVVRDSRNGTVLWEYATGKDGGLFKTLDISQNNKFVACGVDISGGVSVEQSKRHVIGYLFVYDIQGQSLQEIEFNYDVYSRGLPDVKFLPDNRTIVVRNAKSLHFVEIN